MLYQRASSLLSRPWPPHYLIGIRPHLIQDLLSVEHAQTRIRPALIRTLHLQRHIHTRPTTLVSLTSRQWRRYPTSTILGLVRLSSTVAAPRRKSWVARFFWRVSASVGFIGLAITGFIFAFFLYDASTYRSSTVEGSVFVPELALYPRRGGPKNLPIAESLVDDEDDPVRSSQRDKPRLVILGGGWGVSILFYSTLPKETEYINRRQSDPGTMAKAVRSRRVSRF